MTDETTGMQNPIFKIMANQSQASNNGQQNPMGGQMNIRWRNKEIRRYARCFKKKTWRRIKWIF